MATQQVRVIQSDLPAGAATAAAQVTLEADVERVATATELVGTTVGTSGAAVPAKVSVVAGNDGTNARALAVDSSGRQVGIDIVHNYVHGGSHFVWSHTDSDVDIAGPKYVRITAPDTAIRVHLIIEVDIGVSGGLVELYENPTITAAGTAGTPYNSNRNSVGAATATVFYDTTTSADGTMLDSRILGSSGGAARFGGEASTRNEWVLKQNEDYLVKFTASADNTGYSISFSWYEV